ncbi:MAG: ABC transporter permease, partial [candidate division KSB1 bacterium]|nr:ABC transporter permease [candidate division KSB1 bacterium]
YGAVAGYAGGWVDRVLMDVVDILLSVPLFFLVITLLAVVGGGLHWLVLILILGSWMDIARLVRAQVLTLKQQPFIFKARATGLPRRRILFHHLLPNLFATLLAAAILRSADVLLAESALSFLGLGAQPPTASWGTILHDGKAVMATAWWVSIFPGLAIVLTVLSLHWIGESLHSR